MLSLTVHILGDVTVFQCVGRITFAYADALRIAVIKQPRVRVAVLDLARVSAIDAAGLGMLVSLRKWSRSNGWTLKLMNLTPYLEYLLELTGLRSMFQICSVGDMLGYWSIVEPVWDAINIYDGPEVFAQTFASAPRASGLLFAAHFLSVRNLQWRVRPILWEFSWGSRA
jgi:anti-anti-sigma factor